MLYLICWKCCLNVKMSCNYWKSQHEILAISPKSKFKFETARCSVIISKNWTSNTKESKSSIKYEHCTDHVVAMYPFSKPSYWNKTTSTSTIALISFDIHTQLVPARTTVIAKLIIRSSHSQKELYYIIIGCLHLNNGCI